MSLYGRQLVRFFFVFFPHFNMLLFLFFRRMVILFLLTQRFNQRANPQLQASNVAYIIYF